MSSIEYLEETLNGFLAGRTFLKEDRTVQANTTMATI
jgi:hypothetical protein